jgi:hypothetical protein
MQNILPCLRRERKNGKNKLTYKRQPVQANEADGKEKAIIVDLLLYFDTV